MSKNKAITESDPAGNGFLPHLAVDAVIFGFHDGQLKVLLMRYSKTGLYALPGGFVKTDENLNDAAKRVATERTGLTNIYLDQFYVFGDTARHDPSPFVSFAEAQGQSADKDHWLFKRFISVGYFALVDFTKVTPTPDKIFDHCEWFDINAHPALIQDHDQIVAKALDTLRARLDDKLIGFNLLPDEFTMGELQSLYETILDKKLLRPAFQRKMLGLGILQRIAKKFSGGAHRAPYLYRFATK